MPPKTQNESVLDRNKDSSEGDLRNMLPTESRDTTIDPKTERKAVRRSDWIILPTITIFAFLSHLDRSNLGNARVAGLQDDLKITDYQFSIALTITFVPYIAAEIPANLLLKRIGGNVMIPLLVTIWGIITTFQGFVKNYQCLLVARFFLGAVEGGLYPAIVLYVSNFYKRSEIQIRIAMFSASAALSGAVAGVLAYWLIQLDGIGGRPGWAWIFILEGIFTTICGLLGFLVFPLSPSTCRFLTPEQRRIMEVRLEQERPRDARGIEEHFSWFEVFSALKSPHVLLAAAALFMTGSNLYGLAYFQPSIIHSLGYSAKVTQLMSVPPFAVGFIAMLLTSYASDRYRARGITAALCASVAFVGYVMFLTQSSNHIRYASIFLSTAGIYSVSPTLYAWLANNSMPHYRKATAIALGPVAANSGGILSNWLFPSSEKPSYHTATVVNLTFSVGIVFFCGINLIWLRYCNSKKTAERERRQEQSNQAENDIASKEKLELKYFFDSDNRWQLLGDKHPEFIYAY